MVQFPKMIKKRCFHNSLILGSKYLVVLFGEDGRKMINTFEYIDLDNPNTFTEVKLEFKKDYNLNPRWFSHSIVHPIGGDASLDKFLQTKVVRLLVLGGMSEHIESKPERYEPLLAKYNIEKNAVIPQEFFEIEITLFGDRLKVTNIK